MIAQADADAVLGVPVKASEHQQNDRHASHCNFQASDPSHGVNGFAVSLHHDEDAAEAKTQQRVKEGIYSNFGIYAYRTLTGIGDSAFLAVNKAPVDAAFASGPLAALIARQQVLMLVKGSTDVEITVSYFGKERSTAAVEALAKSLAAQI
jgi:hypothetical protein